ncbi:MAG: hypothetical protein GX121_06650 [Ignavibacteria bacterium]|nr:hypothetical protein [Ignavibacteria bacterium]
MKISVNKIKCLEVLSYLFFLLLIGLSIIYTKERILILDPAYYFFNIVNSQDFFIPHGRSTTIINQALLVLATKFNFSLLLCLYVYSTSFVLVKLFYFYLANNVLKNKAAGFAIIAISAIGVGESYFRPTSESTIALLNSILLFAWLCYADKKSIWGQWKVAITLLVSCLFVVFGYVSHAIALFSLIFSILFYVILNNRFKSIMPYLLLTFTLILFLYKIFIGNDNPEHQNLYENVLKSPFSVLKEFDSYYPYGFFKQKIKTLYLPLLSVFFITIVISLRKRKWTHVLFLTLFSISYFFVACVSFKEGESNMQMEKIFLPLTMFSTIVYYSAIKNFSTSNQSVFTIVGILLILFGISTFKRYAPLYVGRIDAIYELVKIANEQEDRKLIVSQKLVDSHFSSYPFVGDWAIGIETLILSTIDKDLKPLTIFVDNGQSNFEEKMNIPDNFMATTFHTSYSYMSLNNSLFRLPEQTYSFWEVDFKQVMEK